MTTPKAGYNPESALARFHAKVDRSGGADACWPWTGSRDKDGYGLASMDRTRRAHRVAIEQALGRPLREGMESCHHCDNPPCCNPAHLFEGTGTDNLRDASAKGRMATGERNAAYTHPDRRPRGSANGWSKLTEGQVAQIKRRLADGEAHRTIAAAFRVTPGAIWFIAKGRNWTHVEAAA